MESGADDPATLDAIGKWLDKKAPPVVAPMERDHADPTYAWIMACQLIAWSKA